MKIDLVLLAGGFGTRLSEYTKSIPKPMVKIGDKPILVHIMKLYAKYGFKEFIIALGYKGNLIKKYFKKKKFNWNIKLVDTGLNTMTGGRLKRLKKIIGNQRFLMTYGDGISNINLKKLLRFHIKNNKLVTLAAVRPPARFGAIKLNGNLVNYFKEKSKLDEGWVNGGWYAGNLSYHLSTRPLVRYKLKNEILKGTILIRGFNEIKDCKGHKFQIVNFNDVCMLGNK